MYVEITLIFTDLQIQLLTSVVTIYYILQIAGALLLPVFVVHKNTSQCVLLTLRRGRMDHTGIRLGLQMDEASPSSDWFCSHSVT